MSTSDSGAGAPIDAREAFDRLGRLVLSEHSMESVLQQVAELAKSVVPGVSDASISLVQGSKASTAAFTGSLAKELDERQYEQGFGPCMAAATGGEVVQIDDLRNDGRWAGFTTAALERGARSMLSVPVPVQEQVSAALNLYGTEVNAFDDDSRELARTFASYAAVAVANMHLYESTRTLAQQLEAAMQSRAVIDQAKGVVMARRRCSADEAFQVLVQLSQHSNRKLREVAQEIVDAVSTGE